MSLNPAKFSRLGDFKLQLLLAAIFGVFILKLIYGVTNSGLPLFLNELFLAVVVYFIVINGKPIVKRQAENPMALIKGILFAGLILLFMSEGGVTLLNLLTIQVKSLQHSPVLYTIINTLYHVVLIFSGVYIYVALGELFFLRQKRNLNTYYNAMSVFFLLSSLTAFLSDNQEMHNMTFINSAFTANAIILVVINSSRISWIAFLSKRDKRALLLFSVGLIVVFIFNLVRIGEGDHATMMRDYSPGLKYFIKLTDVYGVIYFIFLFFTTLFHLPTAEAFDRRTKEITSLQYVSRLLNQVFDFKELASTVTDLATSVCSADAAWIILNNSKDHSAIAPKNIGYVSASAISKVVEEKIDKNVSGVSFFELKSMQKKMDSLEDKFSFAAVAPLRSHLKLNGYLITTKKLEVPFDEDDRNTLESFADYVAVAFENSRLLRESIEKERMEKELDMAREMQRKLIPVNLPDMPNLEIAASFIPAFEVGGDYYDFFNLKDGRMAFIVADVSGKGISAAFIMAELRGIIESVARLMNDPKSVLTKTNEILQRSLDRRHFISAIYGTIDPANGIVNLCRAGHPPVLVASGNDVIELLPRGMGLGLHYSPQFEDSLEEYRLQLEKDNCLILFTDGITEAKNGRMEDYGIENLKNVIRKFSGNSVESLQEQILQSVSLYSQNREQHDDITLLIIKWK